MRAAQNSSWLIEREANLPTYRVVAYGDSIFSGYTEQNPRYYGWEGGYEWGQTNIARRAAPYVASEYLAQKWNANIQVMRRTRANATAGEIIAKMETDKSHMQSPDTRVVMFEMCGSNYLSARRHLKNQSGACNFSELDDTLYRCASRMEEAMRYINGNASPNVKAKVIMNLYYPGYNADNSLISCTDPQTGLRVNAQDKVLSYLAHSNWRACNLAEQYGFKCADAFAEFMGADHDTNGDGLVDSEALRYVPGESEEAYVNRIMVTLRSTLQDANAHSTAPGVYIDYLISDNTHPTFYGNTADPGRDGFVSNTRAPDFSDMLVVGGKNPEWNKWGHERLGWEISKHLPVIP